MTTTRTIQTDQFNVKGASGRSYTVIEHTTQHDNTTISDTQTKWINGLVSYSTIRGGAVNKTATDEFFILDADESATRI